MADINARTRLLIGSTANWAGADLVIGDGELVLERAAAGVKMKVGDGAAHYSALPFLTMTPTIPPQYLTQDQGDARWLQLTGITTTAQPNLVPRLGASGQMPASMIPLPPAIDVTTGTADAGKLIKTATPGGKLDLSFLPPITATSAGVADAGKLVKTAATGKIDPSLITLTAGRYRGTADGTAAVPTGTYVAGDYYTNTKAGLAHASWGLPGGTTLTVGQQLYYNGTSWDAVGTGGAVPLSLPDGTAGAPALSFLSESTLGLWRSKAAVLNAAAPLVDVSGAVVARGWTGFDVTKTGIQAGVAAAAPTLFFNDGTGATDTKSWWILANKSVLRIGALNDAGSNESPGLTFNRAGANIANAAFGAGVSVGVGLTPNAWGSGYLGLQVGGATLMGSPGDTTARLLSNAYYDGAAYRRVMAGAASMIQGGASGILFYLAPGDIINSPITNFAAASMTLDASGNLGLAATPSAWAGTMKAIEGTAGALAFQTTVSTYLTQNLYFNGTNWIYKNAGYGSLAVLNGGGANVYTAGTGAAGGSANIFQAVAIDSLGNVGLGLSAQAKLHILSTASVNSLPTNITTVAGSSIRIDGGTAGAGGYAGITYSSGGGGGAAILFSRDIGYGTAIEFFSYGGGTAFAMTRAMVIGTTGSIADGAGNELGYKGLPVNGISGAYTIAQSDNGKKIVQAGAGAVTCPLGLSVDHTTSVVNNTASAIAIAQGSSTALRWAGTTATGGRTLAPYGVCTIVHAGGGLFFISGSGLS